MVLLVQGTHGSAGWWNYILDEKEQGIFGSQMDALANKKVKLANCMERNVIQTQAISPWAQLTAVLYSFIISKSNPWTPIHNTNIKLWGVAHKVEELNELNR